MNDAGRKKLRSWLQTSLASHSEGGNGLVDYVEAIVGDGEGEVGISALCVMLLSIKRMHSVSLALCVHFGCCDRVCSFTLDSLMWCFVSPPVRKNNNDFTSRKHPQKFATPFRPQSAS